MPYERFEGRDKLYGRRWKDYRNTFLSAHPVCVYCLAMGKIAPATVVDHIKPHKGDFALFWSQDNHQALCARCHNSHKAVEEGSGYSSQVGLDGWPVDPNHPSNQNRERG